MKKNNPSSSPPGLAPFIQYYFVNKNPAINFVSNCKIPSLIKIIQLAKV